MKDGHTIDKNGTQFWYLDGRLHRLDGPALEYGNGGDKRWYVKGKLHRIDGPAIECANGTTLWFVNNKYLGPDDKGFWALWDLLTDEQRSNINLHMWLPGLKK